MDLQPPRAVTEIASRLEDAGYETWAVGGAVRDRLLEASHTDWDLATRAHPKQVQSLFRRTIPVGIEHGTVGVFGADGVLYEVTTFRRDIETFGRHAVVQFADTIDEDLSRRDFTFNALAWHPIRHELRDPFDGLADLKAGVLRTVGAPEERFAEDYLRILRALRFAGHFGLSVQDDTWRALTASTGRLTGLSAERVREELWKVLSKSRNASAALALYAKSGVLAELYPELQALVGLEHDGVDQWDATLRTVDAVPPSRPLLRMAALLQRIGMPAARTKDLRGGWRVTGHEQLGARKAEEVMRRLKSSNAQTEHVRRLVAHQSDLAPPDAGDAVLRKWLRALGPDLIPDLFRLRAAAWKAAPADTRPPAGELAARFRRARAVLHQHPPLTVGDLAIGGTELIAAGISPGPEIGQALRVLLDRVIDDPALNQRDTLLAILERENLR